MSHSAAIELRDRPAMLSDQMDVQSGDGLDTCSPFGLQGLSRDTVQILKPNCIERLAITLAVRGTHEQVRDPEFVKRQLSYRPEWQDEYQIVHLVEKSLWLQGHSDLVMTMTRNPAQVPDNPPQKVLDALSRAYVMHPEATVWYGVPLFSDEKNAEGLPIPVTEKEVRFEAERRIAAAQQHALRWGWLYRSAMSAIRLPSRCWHFSKSVFGHFYQSGVKVADYVRRARRETRERVRAQIIAELERCRWGCSDTVVPEHTTTLGRGIETATLMMEILHYQTTLLGKIAPFLSTAITPIAIASFIPKLIIPLTVMSVDPFLFVELPEEPGKLRHIGHWYWQGEGWGKKKLHLHV